MANAVPFFDAPWPILATPLVSPPRVSKSFWAIATLLAALSLFGVDMRAHAVSFAAIFLFLVGGLPHGAFDIVLARLVFRLSRTHAALLFVAYVSAACVMAAIWWAIPGIALVIFLVLAAYHFGEDWVMLEDRLMRTAVGAAPLAAATFGQFDGVETLFTVMASPSPGMAVSGSSVAALLYAMSPVILLITAIALVIAYQRGAHLWSIAMAIALAALLACPPLLGFALYFGCLHSPRHVDEIHVVLKSQTGVAAIKPILWLHGGVMTALALAAFTIAIMVFVPSNTLSSPLMIGASGFILLSILAVPHLLLSNIMSKHIARNTLS